MSFAWPLLLLSLLVVPLALTGLLLLERRRARYAVRFTNLDVLAGVVASTRPWRRYAPLALFLLGLATLAVALARPRVAASAPDERARVILTIDVSGSMVADDVRPTRLEAAKAAARRFLDVLPKQIQVGVVAFSSVPVVVGPTTHDRALTREAIDLLEPMGGTAIGDAIWRSVELAQANPAGDAPGSPPPAGVGPPAAILLLSDGSQTTGILQPLEAAARAHARGIRIYTVALGTESGTITITRDGFSRQIPVPPDPELLRQIAQETGGTFFRATTASELKAVYQRLGSSVGRKPSTREVTNLFVAGGALLLLVAGGLSALRLPRLP